MAGIDQDYKIISVYVTPKASRNVIIGWMTDPKGEKSLKVKVTAPPDNGQANAELLRFLAQEWGVAKTSLSIVSGEASRTKRVKVPRSALPQREV